MDDTIWTRRILSLASRSASATTAVPSAVPAVVPSAVPAAVPSAVLTPVYASLPATASVAFFPQMHFLSFLISFLLRSLKTPFNFFPSFYFSLIKTFLNGWNAMEMRLNWIFGVFVISFCHEILVKQLLLDAPIVTCSSKYMEQAELIIYVVS